MGIPKLLRGLFLAVLLSLFVWLGHSFLPVASSAQTELFDAVWETVDENFYDPNFNGVDWAAMREKYRAPVKEATSQAKKLP